MPLGDAYLELVAVVDPESAAATSFGRWVAHRASAGGSVLGWAVRPDDLERVATRLDLPIEPGSRTKPSGELVEWRMAGIDASARRPWLPFFLEWGDAAMFPGATEAPNATIARLEIEGDAGELADWLGAHELPIDVTPGKRGLTRVQLDGPGGPIALAS